MEEEEEQSNISPVGLVNLSRYQKIKGYKNEIPKLIKVFIIKNI
jgi:hypothetical protein